MVTRVRAAAVFAVLLASSASAFAEEALRGIELSDIDRSADACTDFFEFSNGAWRAANPIPASMSRWSRRWKSGEESKEQLKGILEETAAKKDSPKGSIDQLVGDFYAACMDETARNAAGVKPLAAALAEIAAMKTSTDVVREIGRLHAIGISVPFGVAGGSDNHNPSDVIAADLRERPGASRPRLLLQDGAALRGRAREVPGVRREALRARGLGPGPREGGGRDGLRVREKARRGAPRQRGAAQPEGHRPQDGLRRPPEADPRLRLASATRRRRGSRGGTSTSTSRSS